MYRPSIAYKIYGPRYWGVQIYDDGEKTKHTSHRAVQWYSAKHGAKRAEAPEIIPYEF